MNKTLIQHDGIRPWIEAYFRDHPEQASLRHHADVDAEALRWAFAKALSNGTP